MQLVLKAVETVRYSRTEQQLFKLLPQNGKRITTEELIERVYDGRKRARPLNPRQSMNSALTRLREKVLRNKEPFRIEKSELRGPHPAEWWIERRG